MTIEKRIRNFCRYPRPGTVAAAEATSVLKLSGKPTCRTETKPSRAALPSVQGWAPCSACSAALSKKDPNISQSSCCWAKSQSEFTFGSREKWFISEWFNIEIMEAISVVLMVWNWPLSWPLRAAAQGRTLKEGNIMKKPSSRKSTGASASSE